MRILILSPYYAPDLGPGAPLLTMLAEGLGSRGHDVSVVTTVPHYPSGVVEPHFKGKWIWRSLEGRVRVTRIGLPSVQRAHLSLRLLQMMCYQLGATLTGIGKECGVVLAVNPGFGVLLPVAWWAALSGKPMVFSVYDVYPDVGVRLGIFRHKPVIAAVSALERFCLSQALAVHIIAESFRPSLRRLGVAESRMTVIYPWVDTESIRPAGRDNAFAREYGLGSHFVVLYAGNIGWSQGLESILLAAERLADQEDIRFVFVGDGSGRELLQSMAQERRLSNVQFVPFQPRQRLPEVLASASVSLVSLRRGVSAESLPSKMFSIMASGRPIIACVDRDSEPWKLVEQARAGLCIEPENPRELIQAILALKSNPELREQLGRNGRSWAEQRHSPLAATMQFEQLLERAIALSGRARSRLGRHAIPSGGPGDET